MSYFVAFLSILLGAVAQYFLKLGMLRYSSQETKGVEDIIFSFFLNLPLIGGLACYGLSMVFWLYVLSKLELSRAYPLVSLGYIVTLFLGYVFLNEPLTFNKLLGIAFIILGVFFVSR